MTDIQITGYHTCSADGGWSYIRENGPFLSGNGSNQWLTQGYYFWTDSTHFAKKWGEKSYDNQYAIMECSIEIDSALLYDLVGSVEDQLHFRTMLTKFIKHLKKIDNCKEPTVNAVISYWRKVQEKNKGVFPYLAIKTQDELNGPTLVFTGIGLAEQMFVGIRRQQLCLFEDGLNCLKEKRIIYPDEFMEQEKLCQI